MSAPLVPFDLNHASITPIELAAAKARLKNVGDLVAWLAIMIAGGQIFDAWGWSFLAGGIVSLVGCQQAWARHNRLDRAAVQIITQAGDVTEIGALLDATEFCKRDTAIQNALNRLLPQLTQEHIGDITQAQRQLMITLLFQAPAETMITLLGALEHVGDAHALPYVTSLARGKAIPGHASQHTPAIVAAADRCAAAINVRIAAVKISDTLLRAASLPEESPAVLLRSSEQSHTTAMDQLLLPHEGQENDESAEAD
jgi:hypothetical protein